MALASDWVARLTDALEPQRDPDRAIAMAAYMRDQFAFLGVPSAVVDAAVRSSSTGLAKPAEADLVALAEALWRKHEREYQYAACGILRRHAKLLTPAFLPTAEHLVTTKSWWDTVDALAAHTVGTMVRRHVELRPAMDEWLRSDNMWKARVALLHQLAWKAETDADWLFAACLERAADKDFFLRKAIGWALRSYSYVDGAAVRRFVRDHDAELSGLSKREALKALDRAAQKALDRPASPARAT